MPLHSRANEHPNSEPHWNEFPRKVANQLSPAVGPVPDEIVVFESKIWTTVDWSASGWHWNCIQGEILHSNHRRSQHSVDLLRGCWTDYQNFNTCRSDRHGRHSNRNGRTGNWFTFIELSPELQTGFACMLWSRLFTMVTIAPYPSVCIWLCADGGQ